MSSDLKTNKELFEKGETEHREEYHGIVAGKVSTSLPSRQWLKISNLNFSKLSQVNYYFYTIRFLIPLMEFLDINYYVM